ISSKFAPLLNVEPCIVNPSYVIEIADGESVEVDRVIRDCKLKLGNSLFTIDLIPLGHGRFDTVGSWKAVIELHFHRHVVNQSGIHVDPSNIKAVNNWKAPTTPSKIRSFFRLAGYYWRFIAAFSKIAKPLTLLTQKNQKYEWGEKEEEAFQTLKNNLCDAPILSLLDEIEDFVVYCDHQIKE
nr:putative reverse transcriptase domain-containing protein [Tanacetum cinerariifolium]